MGSLLSTLHTIKHIMTSVSNMNKSSSSVRLWLATFIRQVVSWLIILADNLDVEDIKLSEQVIVVDNSEVLDNEEEEEVSDKKRDRKETISSEDSGLEYEIPDFTTGRDEDTGLDLISLDEVSYHCMREDAWIVIYDKVYEMTEYLEGAQHPGGEDVILEYLGYDATLAFRGVNHSRSALRVLDKYALEYCLILIKQLSSDTLTIPFNFNGKFQFSSS